MARCYPIETLLREIAVENDFANIDEPELIDLSEISCLPLPTSIIDLNVFSDSSRSSSTSACSTLVNATFRPISSHESSLATPSTSALHPFSHTPVVPQSSGLSPRSLQTILETSDDPVLERISEEIWTEAIFQYLRQLKEEEEEEEDEKHNEDCERHLQRSLKRKHE